MRRFRIFLLIIAVLLQGTLPVLAVAHAAGHLGAAASMQVSEHATGQAAGGCHSTPAAGTPAMTAGHTSCCAAGHCDCGGCAAAPLTTNLRTPIQPTRATTIRGDTRSGQPSYRPANPLRPPIPLLN